MMAHLPHPILLSALHAGLLRSLEKASIKPFPAATKIFDYIVDTELANHSDTNPSATLQRQATAPISHMILV